MADQSYLTLVRSHRFNRGDLVQAGGPIPPSSAEPSQMLVTFPPCVNIVLLFLTTLDLTMTMERWGWSTALRHLWLRR